MASESYTPEDGLQHPTTDVLETSLSNLLRDISRAEPPLPSKPSPPRPVPPSNHPRASPRRQINRRIDKVISLTTNSTDPLQPQTTSSESSPGGCSSLDGLLATGAAIRLLASN